MTLQEAVKKVIDQNNSIGYHPMIFNIHLEYGKAKNLEEKVLDLIRNPETREEVEKAIKKYGKVLTIEDLIVQGKSHFNLPKDVVEESKKRKEEYDWYRNHHKNNF